MAVYVAPLADYDSAYTKMIEEDSDHDYPNFMAEYDSHLFAMETAELINNTADTLHQDAQDFFNIIFWDWMNEGKQIYESSLDPDEAMLNSAIPSTIASALYDKISKIDPEELATLLHNSSEVFDTPTSLATYLKVWWSIFKTAQEQNYGVLIHAD